MSFKSLWFACCTTPLLMGVGAIPYGQHSPGGVHVSNAVTHVLPKRQEQPWRNETRAWAPPATTWIISSVAPEASSTSAKEHATTVSRSESVNSIATTLVPSPSNAPSKDAPSMLKPSGTAHDETSSLKTVLASSHLPTYVWQSSSQVSENEKASLQHISSSLQLSVQQPSSATSITVSNLRLSASQRSATAIPTLVIVPTSGHANQLETTVRITITSVSSLVVGVSASVPGPSETPLESESKHLTPESRPSVASINPPLQVASSQTTGAIGMITTRLQSSSDDGPPRVPAIPTNTLQDGTSQTATTSLLTLVTDTVRTGSSNSKQPSLSAPIPVASNTIANIQFSSALGNAGSSNYFVPVASWSSPVASFGSPAPTLDQWVVTGTFSTVPSRMADAPSSNVAIIPVSESPSHLSPTPTHTPGLTQISTTPSGAFFSDVSGTAVMGRPSETAHSCVTTESRRQSQNSATISPIPEAVSSSKHRISSANLGLSDIRNTRITVSSVGTSYNYMIATSASSSAVLESFQTATPTARQANSTSLSAVWTTRSLINIASGGTSQLVYQTTKGQHRWNRTSSVHPAASPTSPRVATVPTGFISNYNTTRLGAAQASKMPVWSNSTVTDPVTNDTMASGAASQKPIVSPTTNLDASTTSAAIPAKSNTGPARTVSSTRASTSSASATAAAAPPPLLTTSQTAGVAIAGTTGLLIAVVAAIYMARRYHAKKARRSSTGSVYPKVAYLYDPPEGGDDDGPTGTYMSGGSNGMPIDEQSCRAPPNSPHHSQRYSTGMLPMRYSDPGNPFRDPEDPLRHSTGSSTRTPAGAAAAISAAIRGYRATSQSSPNLATFPEGITSHDIGTASSGHGRNMTGDRSPSRSSILSDIASMAYISHGHPNAATLRYQPLSPYAYHQNHSLPCVRETVYTDPFRDPFEHDLLLQVDTRTETPDFVTVYAPSPPTTAIKPVKILSKNPWASSMLSPVTTQGPPRAQSRLIEESPVSPDTTIVASERLSLVYDNQSSTTYIAPSRKQAHDTISPISPPAEPAHRGWDDIKRYSAEKVIPPSVISLSPPLRHNSPPPVKKKSLPQLRRKEMALSGSPLTVKISFTYHKNSSVDGHKLSHFAKLDSARARHGDDVRSPDSTFSHSVHSLASLVHKKQSRDLEFACAGL